MKKLPFILFVLIPFLSFSQAQEDNEINNTPQFKHNLGFGAGFTTGYGLSYRFFPKKLGAQVNFAPFMDEYTSRYSIGLTLLLRLVQTEKTSFYIYQGNHYFIEESKYRNFNGNSSNINSYSNNGIGLGLELIAGKRVAFNLMGGYAGIENFEKINFTSEIAIYYKF